jgi:mRNA interferase RelE/StbE
MNVEFTRSFEKPAFRIRTGNYRIGIIFHQQTVYFAEVAHRKEIYKLFP